MDAIEFLRAVQGVGQPDLPLDLRLATVDPAYNAFATWPTVPLPQVTFDGEATMSTKRYPLLAGYLPTASDRVLMAPVGRTYVVIGAIRANSTVTRPDAQYNGSGTQTIATGGPQFVAFGTTNISTALVTRTVNGTGHVFTLNKTGVWTISTCIRYLPSAAGSREIWLQLNAGRLAANEQPGSGASNCTLTFSVTQWRTNGDGVAVGTYQNSGGNLDLVVDNTNATSRIDLVYHGVPTA